MADFIENFLRSVFVLAVLIGLAFLAPVAALARVGGWTFGIFRDIWEA